MRERPPAVQSHSNCRRTNAARREARHGDQGAELWRLTHSGIGESHDNRGS